MAAWVDYELAVSWVDVAKPRSFSKGQGHVLLFEVQE